METAASRDLQKSKRVFAGSVLRRFVRRFFT